MDITVIVTTWGHPSWAGMASRVAIPSIVGQDAMLYHHHEPDTPSAGAARNRAVEIADPQDWICFVDADDKLAPDFIDVMNRRLDELEHVVETLVAPALQLGNRPPETYEGRDIVDGINPCPIGTLIHRDMFEQAGQFWGERAWEDWSLFRRAVLAGADIAFESDAVYIAADSPNGRNRNIRQPQQLRRSILQSHAEWMSK